MAFFKSRSNNTASAEERNTESGEAQSMDVLRQRARHRLIGATVLVLVAVIGFPLVFDTKPREVASDIRIDMPEREAVRPSQVPTAPVAEVKAPPPVPDEVKAPVSQAPEPEPKEAAKPIEPAPAAEVSASKAADNTKSKEDAAPRYVVQVGAFSDEAKVKEVRGKLEKAGLKTYVHVAQTKDGKRTRVRIGPFATKEEAQKTVNKIKALHLTAAVLTL